MAVIIDGTTGITSPTAVLASPLLPASGGTGGSATPTAGGVVYGTGTVQAVSAAGTSGQLLQSNGASAPTWSTPSSGALILLATITPTVAANVDFLSTFSSTYDCYLITCTGVTPADFTSSPGVAFRVANGGVVDTASSYNGASSNALTTATATQITAGGSNQGPFTFQLFIANANDTTNYKNMSLQLQYSANGGSTGSSNTFFGGTYRGTSAISGMRIFWSNGANFTATGKIRVYGYQNS
jgi:hypothetical protein